ncbi:hypothetical protein BGZ60DRAFT_495615 [Tricladium varicosporioides]|nr:hypothetical protein BGZ60DRAFT_495615 [Hymenoscyphus varicosporioides]
MAAELPRDMVSPFRRSAPKSRQGCITCKIRRVKCDERKPTCVRCTSTFRKCDGYAPEPKIIQQKPLKSRPKVLNVATIKYARNLDIIYSSPLCEGAEVERRSVYYFRRKQLAGILGAFEPDFWTQTVLQLSHRYEAIGQSLVTLTSLLELHEKADARTGPVATGRINDLNILVQYTKAIAAVARYISQNDQDPRISLISCLMFVWIEIFRGDLASAFQHLTSGVRILESSPGLKPKINIATHSQKRDELLAFLTRSFARLKVQATIHGSVSAKIPFSCNSSKYSVSSPSSFSNIFESRGYLDTLIQEIFGHMRELHDNRSLEKTSAVDFTALELRETYLHRLEEWYSAHQCLIGRAPQLVKDEAPSFQYLQLYYRLMNLMLESLVWNSEMNSDNYSAGFADIIKISTDLLDVSQLQPEGKPRPLCVDMGIIPPLFFLALKCRVLKLREQAIALLKRGPEQEGLWFRERVVKFSEWKVAMEEAGRGDLPTTSPLPESARIYQEHLVRETGPDGDTVMKLGYRRGAAMVDIDDHETVELTPELEGVKYMGNML